MQLKTRKNISSSTELEQYTKQSVFLYFPYISYGKKKFGGTIAIVPVSTIKKNFGQISLDMEMYGTI